jgi:glycosyltransferase
MPAHPTLYVRSAVYERLGAYDTRLRIAADYDFILRYFSQLEADTVYIPEVLYKMRVGGESNRSLTKIRTKMTEDYRALRGNKVGGVTALALKNLSKLGQFTLRASD